MYIVLEGNGYQGSLLNVFVLSFCPRTEHNRCLRLIETRFGYVIMHYASCIMHEPKDLARSRTFQHKSWHLQVFAPLMFAGLHNQSSLLTVVCAANCDEVL